MSILSNTYNFHLKSLHRRCVAILIVLGTHTSLMLAGSATSLIKTELPDWTFLVYVQGNNSLGPFAQKNFTDMASIGSTKDLNVLVQWHDPAHNGVWRYKIERGKMHLDMHLPTATDGNSSHDLVDSASWALTKYPAKKFALILWNHGIGVLDPIWGSHSLGLFNQASTIGNARIELEGITKVLPQKKISSKRGAKIEHRGILFNDRTKTYMSNQTLSHALSTIKTNLLKSKKIDLLGMDACFMAMTEVCYQVRNYADYFVGSQDVELAYGWGYAHVLQKFLAKPTPLEAAQGIVNHYERFYRNKIDFYTQSAVDLKLVPEICKSMNLVVQNIKTCYQIDKKSSLNALKQARHRAVEFSTPNYIDLHSFLGELWKSMNTTLTRATKIPATQQTLRDLKDAIDVTQKCIEGAVVSNVVGKDLARARGLSVYYPTSGPLDSSYFLTEFSNDCNWRDLLLMSLGY